MMILVHLTCEDSFDRVPHAKFLLVVALYVILTIILLNLCGEIDWHFSCMPLVQVVIDILADFRLALDLARVLASKEGWPRVTIHHCRKVR